MKYGVLLRMYHPDEGQKIWEDLIINKKGQETNRIIIRGDF